MDAMDGEQLSLAAVRDTLVWLEDSVVVALLERARQPHNAPVYAHAASGGDRSLVEFVGKHIHVRPRQRPRCRRERGTPAARLAVKANEQVPTPASIGVSSAFDISMDEDDAWMKWVHIQSLTERWT
ncbi:unnamed protein product [Urochloa humidicola]